MIEPLQNKADIAEYIGEMCAELRQMADKAGFESLAFLLAMAALEATKKSGRQ